ncbi:MAG: methylthioribulose 1-phosphate dehydratase [Myxococcota bacterium]
MKTRNEDLAAERTQLAQVGRDLHARGWVPATAGNLSVRNPDGTVWITASGTHKGHLGFDDFVHVDLEGTVLPSTPPHRKPSAETSLHLAVYRTQPEAAACLHVHTVASTLVHRTRSIGAQETKSLVGQPDGRVFPLRLPSLELIKAFGIWDEKPAEDVWVFPNLPRVADIAALVETAFASRPSRVPGFLIADHGLTTWGPDLTRTGYVLEAFDFLFRCMLEARAAHLPD